MNKMEKKNIHNLRNQYINFLGVIPHKKLLLIDENKREKKIVYCKIAKNAKNKYTGNLEYYFLTIHKLN